MYIFKQMCQRREGVTVLAVDLHSSAIFKRKGVGGNSGFSLGSFCCFASLLVCFWVVGWWVGCWFVCGFFGIMLLPMLLLVNNRVSVYTSVC